ncbi:MAG: P-II family nitrogen regulator [Gemmatimonadales bacterium]
MHLLVCVINKEEKLEAVLSGFLDVGVTGATVIRSEGMGRKLGRELPALAGLQALLSESRPHNTTVFSVIESREKLDRAVARVCEICGDFSAPDTGIVFTVPVDRVVGLAPELERG